MQNFIKMLVLFALLLVFSACEAPPSATLTPTVAPPSGESSLPPPPTELEDPTPPTDAAPPPEPTPVAVPDEQWEGKFRTFIEAEYDKIFESFVSGIAGLGFIDLDFDNSPELIIFDLGASTSMGVQIFDVIGGEVECIAANIPLVGEVFGRGHLSSAAISANEFAAFRLIRERATGTPLFIAHSVNGAVDFLNSEIITFRRGAADEVVVSKFLSKFEEYAESDDGERILSSQRFEYRGEEIDEERYSSAMAEFEANYEDADYEAHGVFIWENAAYEREFQGLVAMFDAAVKAYIPPDGN